MNAALAAALLAVLACGSDGERAEPICRPVTCEALGASCGEPPDGCEGTLSCGGCPEGRTCGGGGVPFQCGAPACQPVTCAALRKDCGTVSDGCGGTLDCGSTCPPGSTCGGGGTANVCGAPACTPATCAALRKDCGTVPDGCGGTLACGACPGGLVCGAGGEANVCAEPPATGALAWSFTVSTAGPDVPLAVGVDRAGTRHLLALTANFASGGAHTLRLARRDARGADQGEWRWTFHDAWPYQSFGMAVAPGGDVLVLVKGWCDASCSSLSVDLGGGPLTDSALVKLGPDGKVRWQRSYAGEHAFGVWADASGGALVLLGRRSDGQARVEKIGPDGTPAWSRERSPAVSWWAMALAPDGDVLMTTDDGGVGLERRAGRDGALRWRTALPGAGFGFAVDASDRGTALVLAGRAGDVAFGGAVVREGGLVLYAVEADGRARWARGFEDLAGPVMAVDPTGRVAVAGQSSAACGAAVVEALRLDGSPLWRQAVPGTVEGCWSVGPPLIAYGADHGLFVAAGFWTRITLGEAVYLPRGQDVFGVGLSP